jgi:beta-aspartyl-peptidase (threonine type)
VEAELKPSMIVHGGAWDIPNDMVDGHKSGCRAALLLGWEVLQSGGDALEAVEVAIRAMEDDPIFDAGTGSVLNTEGEAELDASIMEGRGLEAGAVAAVKGIKNPISLARRVLDSEHVMLVGRGASLFAKELGIPECSPEELVVERELKRWGELQREKSFHPEGFFGARDRGTVGAVAIDKKGDIAAGDSTGGSPFKRPGRVGDSPLIGCGIYADNELGGVACTGWGESIIRVVLAKTAVDMLAAGGPAEGVAAQAVRLLQERVGGRGGLIMIDRHGRVGYAFNTSRMAHAHLTEGLNEPVVGV